MQFSGKIYIFSIKFGRILKRIRTAGQTESPPDYNSSNIPAGLSTMCRAPASSSSARSRNPHVTPTERTPAAAAVCMSTPESPT